MTSETGEAVAGPNGFATTRWSLILSATDSKGEEQTAHQALAELCRAYWRPVFLFVSHRGYPVQEAQDLTQNFFVMILETNWLRQADQHRGRFRSFLLKSVQNFLNNVQDRRQTIKRGGRVEFVSWDEWLAETPSQLMLPDYIIGSLPPEHFFDLRWAATVVDHAMQRLREECERKGRLRLFDTLRSYLGSERGDITYSDLAIVLGIAETMVKKQLHNLRERFRWILRDEVAHTVENPGEVDDEIRHLCTVLAAAEGNGSR